MQLESADERIYSDRLMKRRDRIWARVANSKPMRGN
jgi:hypothetical protein